MGGWTQTSHEYGWLRTSFQIWMNGTAHFFLFAQCYSTQSYTVLKPTSRGQWWMHTLSCLSLRFFYIWSNISVWSAVFLAISKVSSRLWNLCMSKEYRLQRIHRPNVNNYALCMWSVFLISAKRHLGLAQRSWLGPCSTVFKAFPKQKTDLHCKSIKYFAYVRNAGQAPQCNYFCSLI